MSETIDLEIDEAIQKNQFSECPAYQVVEVSSKDDF